MVIEESAGKLKKEVFTGLSAKERHSEFLRLVNGLLTKKKKITQSEYDSLVLMVVDERFPASHKINKFIKFFAGRWLDEVFDIRVMPEKEPAAKKVVNDVEYDDDEYDPEMLKLAGEHPEEWSKEVVKQEIAAKDKWSEDE